MARPATSTSSTIGARRSIARASSVVAVELGRELVAAESGRSAAGEDDPGDPGVGSRRRIRGAAPRAPGCGPRGSVGGCPRRSRSSRIARTYFRLVSVASRKRRRGQRADPRVLEGHRGEAVVRGGRPGEVRCRCGRSGPTAWSARMPSGGQPASAAACGEARRRRDGQRRLEAAHRGDQRVGQAGGPSRIAQQRRPRGRGARSRRGRPAGRRRSFRAASASRRSIVARERSFRSSAARARGRARPALQRRGPVVGDHRLQRRGFQGGADVRAPAPSRAAASGRPGVTIGSVPCSSIRAASTASASPAGQRGGEPVEPLGGHPAPARARAADRNRGPGSRPRPRSATAAGGRLDRRRTWPPARRARASPPTGRRESRRRTEST